MELFQYVHIRQGIKSHCSAIEQRLCRIKQGAFRVARQGQHIL